MVMFVREHKKLCPGLIKPYRNVRHELSEHEGVFFRGEHIVVLGLPKASAHQLTHRALRHNKVYRTRENYNLLAR